MINRVLDIEQLKKVITLIFRGKSLKIDRIIKNTGIHKKSCWVSYWNEKGERWSTFISKADLQKAFWEWLSTIRILNLNQALHHCGMTWGFFLSLKVFSN
jgi:hypothetical protein